MEWWSGGRAVKKADSATGDVLLAIKPNAAQGCYKVIDYQSHALGLACVGIRRKPYKGCCATVFRR